MKVRIENYEISILDERNFVVEELKTVKDEETGVPKEIRSRLGYFSRLAGAVRKVAELSANKQPLLELWLKQYQSTVDQITKQFDHIKPNQ